MGNPLGLTRSWLSLAETAAAQEKWADAAAYFSAAEACGVYNPHDSQFKDAETLRGILHTNLTPAAFDAAWQRGLALTCDDDGLH